MDTQETREFIDDVYATINISHAWFVYDHETTEERDLTSLIDWLHKENYPVCVVGNADIRRIEMLEQTYRLFIINKKDVPMLLYVKRYDIRNVSVVLCASQATALNVSMQLPQSEREKVLQVC